MRLLEVVAAAVDVVEVVDQGEDGVVGLVFEFVTQQPKVVE